MALKTGTVTNSSGRWFLARNFSACRESAISHSMDDRLYPCSYHASRPACRLPVTAGNVNHLFFRHGGKGSGPEVGQLSAKCLLDGFSDKRPDLPFQHRTHTHSVARKRRKAGYLLVRVASPFTIPALIMDSPRAAVPTRASTWPATTRHTAASNSSARATAAAE